MEMGLIILIMMLFGTPGMRCLSALGFIILGLMAYFGYREQKRRAAEGAILIEKICSGEIKL